MAEIKIFGYANKISVKQGENIDFHVTADGTSEADAKLVRLIHGDQHPTGPGFIEKEIENKINGKWKVEKQFTQLGSFLKVKDPDCKLATDESFTIFTYIFPTTPKTGERQKIIGRFDVRTNEGYCIGISPEGYLEFGVGDGKEIDYLASELPIVKKVWYFIAATFNPKTGEATLYQEGVLNRYNSLLGKVVPYDYRSHVKTTFRFKQKNRKDVPFVMSGGYDFHENF